MKKKITSTEKWADALIVSAYFKGNDEKLIEGVIDYNMTLKYREGNAIWLEKIMDAIRHIKSPALRSQFETELQKDFFILPDKKNSRKQRKSIRH